MQSKHVAPWRNSKQRYPTIDHDIEVDVAIVGGGVAGIGAAYALSKSKKSVALLEASVMASGLSGLGSGAMVAGADLDFWQMIERYGVRESVAWMRETYAMRREIVRTIRSKHLDCDLDAGGSLMIAFHEDEIPTLEKEARLRKRYGFPCKLVRGSALQKMIRTPGLVALHVPGDALVVHSKLVLAFAKLASARVRFFERTPVLRLRREGRRFVLQTPRGFVTASKVVLAASGVSAALAPGLPVPPRELVCSALTRRLNAAERRAIGWNRAHALWTLDIHSKYQMMRLMPDGRLLITGSEPDKLAGFLRAIFPQPHGVTIERAWSGAVDTPRDAHPLVGRRGNLFYSYGLTSHGLLHAFLNGKKIARMMR